MASAVGKPVHSIHSSPLQRAAEVRRSAGLVCRPLKQARKKTASVPTAKAVGYGSCVDAPGTHDHGSRPISQHEFTRREGWWLGGSEGSTRETSALRTETLRCP